MTRTDLLLLIIGFLAGFVAMVMLLVICLCVLAKRDDDEEERLYLERRGEQRDLSPGFVHSQRHTSSWQ